MFTNVPDDILQYDCKVYSYSFQALPQDNLTLTPPPSSLPVVEYDLDPCDLDPCDVHLELIDDHLVFLGSSSPGDLWKLRVLLQPGGYGTTEPIGESKSGSAWFWGGGGGLEPGPDPGPHSRDRGPDCESLI